MSEDIVINNIRMCYTVLDIWDIWGVILFKIYLILS